MDICRHSYFFVPAVTWVTFTRVRSLMFTKAKEQMAHDLTTSFQLEPCVTKDNWRHSIGQYDAVDLGRTLGPQNSRLQTCSFYKVLSNPMLCIVLFSHRINTQNKNKVPDTHLWMGIFRVAKFENIHGKSKGPQSKNTQISVSSDNQNYF